MDLKKSEFDEIYYIGTDEKFISYKSSIKAVLSMDIPSIREKLFYIHENRISNFISHHTANISKRAFIKNGTLIQSNTLISSYVKIGKGCLINHNVSIHHESEIGDFTVIAPRATILGRVKIGKNSYIGAGSIIKQNVSIGSNVTIGAGAVVLNDISDNTIIVGNPAKRIIGNSI